jgi:hypothetical protein
VLSTVACACSRSHRDAFSIAIPRIS